MAIKVSPIKSQGVKSKLVSHIMALLEQNHVKLKKWIEPFLGTCVVPLNIAAKSYYLSDINPHLVEFYKAIQNGTINPDYVKQFLKKAGEELSKAGENYYYSIRERFNLEHNPLDFLFLNRSCFNGMIRFNKKGEFNVPFCRKPYRFSQAYITKICNQIRILHEFFRYNTVDIKCCDFKETIAQAGEHDFIYCDPPYIDRYNDYYNGWTEDQETMLFKLLKKGKSKFILSTWHHNDFRKNKYIDSLWHNFSIITLDHFYHLGASEENRCPMVEALVTNLDLGQAKGHPPRGIKKTQMPIQQSLIPA